MEFPTIEQCLSTDKTTSVYTLTFSLETQAAADEYLKNLLNEICYPGHVLGRVIVEKEINLSKISVDSFMRVLVNLKNPIVSNNELSDPEAFTNIELRLLASIGTVLYSYAFNNGGQAPYFLNYFYPLPCVMGFISIPFFLENGQAPYDLHLTKYDKEKKIWQINRTHYYHVLMNILLPVLIEMSSRASVLDKRLDVTVPDLVCVKNEVTSARIYRVLDDIFRELLTTYAHQLKGIRNISIAIDNVELPDIIVNCYHIRYRCISSSLNDSPRQPLALENKEKDPCVLLGTIVVMKSPVSWACEWGDNHYSDAWMKSNGTLARRQIIQSVMGESNLNWHFCKYDPERKIYCVQGVDWYYFAHQAAINNRSYVKPYIPMICIELKPIKPSMNSQVLNDHKTLRVYLNFIYAKNNNIYHNKILRKVSKIVLLLEACNAHIPPERIKKLCNCLYHILARRFELGVTGGFDNATNEELLKQDERYIIELAEILNYTDDVYITKNRIFYLACALMLSGIIIFMKFFYIGLELMSIALLCFIGVLYSNNMYFERATTCPRWSFFNQPLVAPSSITNYVSTNDIRNNIENYQSSV